MEMPPDFLERLGLAPDADERQVRRAYARELKAIDQERDLEGFQYLRACYEAALEWAAVRAAQGEPACGQAQVAMIADAATTQDGSLQTALLHADATHMLGSEAPEPDCEPGPGAHVFEAFRARLPGLAQLPDLATRSDKARVAPWVSALNDALADPRLLHLDARLAFERQVAALLADGWRPGHQLLLPAAAEVFAWNSDRGTLARLGYPGMVIDAALDQHAMFRSQDVLARERQREVLSLLRQENPDPGAIERRIGIVRILATYFPHMTHVVAPQAALEGWLERFADVEPAPFDDAAPATWRDRLSALQAYTAPILVISFFVCFNLLASRVPDPVEPPPRHSFPKLEPFDRGAPVTDERMEEIRRHIEFRPVKGTLLGEHVAAFKVFLGADGTVSGMNTLRSSGDPAFTAAVEKAIRASGPFPPETKRMVDIEFHAIVSSKPLTQQQLEQAWTGEAAGPSPQKD